MPARLTALDNDWQGNGKTRLADVSDMPFVGVAEMTEDDGPKIEVVLKSIFRCLRRHYVFPLLCMKDSTRQEEHKRRQDEHPVCLYQSIH